MSTIRINLLPHREHRKARQRKNLIAAVGGTLITALAIVAGGHFVIAGMKENQAARNELLRQEIVKLDAQIKEIEELRAKTDALLNRKKVVETLQNNRSDLVHLFDEMARLTPDGVFLTSLKQTGDKLELQGMAQSSARVSTLMQNLEGSPRFDTPNLIEVKAATKDNYRVGQFSMNVKQTPPQPAKPGGDNPGEPPKAQP
jgi:type IV pilus assembly protein PilN